MATPLQAGQTFVMTQKVSEKLTALYPVTKTANVRNDDGTDLPTLLSQKANTNHGNHVPAPEQANPLKFLQCDNKWAEIQHATTAVYGTVILTDSTTLDDSTKAATAKAVKIAYDKANHSHPYIGTDKMGTPNGVATLDSTGTVPASQLPSFVDDVLEGTYVNETTFNKPAGEEEGEPEAYEGETGKIYVDTQNGKTYRWSGSRYVVISDTLALGTTSSTAFRGDYGNAAYQHSQAAHARVDATLTEKSEQNGYVKINGTETLVYTHPGSGTNPHGTTKGDLGLGKVENLSAEEIIDTLTKSKIEEIIGGTVATTVIASESQNGLMSTEHVKKLNACMRIYIQKEQPAEDGLWLKLEDAV